MWARFLSFSLVATAFFIVYQEAIKVGTFTLEELKIENLTEKQPILILHWNKAYDKYVFLNEDLEQCPSLCTVTTDRSRALEADVITFHGMHFMMKHKSKKLTDLRKASNATFVFHVREPPTLTKNLGNWSYDFFDATMTYRFDSTIFNALYEIVRKNVIAPREMSGRWIKKPDLIKADLQSFKHKTKLASWLVSKCVTPGKREIFVNELQKWMRVDTFGKCGQRISPRKDSDSNVEVYRKLLRPYFFYLSFENTRCKNYISEKFYHVLASGAAIPVVFGPSKKNYEAVAPPKSFIHVSDFKNAKALAKYLNQLSSNLTSYAEYFWWNEFYEVKRTELVCSTCEKLSRIRKSPTKHRIKDFNGFWVNEAECNSPKTSPWNLQV